MATKPGFIQQELARTNRWWHEPETWYHDDEDLNRAALAPFDYSANVLDDLTPGGMYTLSGPRRVGKSVAVKQTIKKLIREGVNPGSISHFSVDGWRAGDLTKLADAVHQMSPGNGERFWFIDEITGMSDEWPNHVKWLRDNYPGFGRETVILTGSSSSDLRAATGLWGGRHGPATDPYRVLLPMGFRSFAALIGLSRGMPEQVGPARIADLRHQRLTEATYELRPWLNDLMQAWEIYLQVGGFPEAVSDYLWVPTTGQQSRQGHLGFSEVASDHLRAVKSRLPAELFRIISGGAFRRTQMSNLQTRVLLQRLTEGLGSPTNASNLARDLDVTSITMKQRLTELREAFAVWPAHREKNGRAQLRARRKTYFTDPIYTRLADDRWLDLSLLSEQQLGMALVRNLERSHPGTYIDFGRVLYHRSPAGAEIDFTGPDFGGVAIESKYVDDGWRRGALRTLAASPWEGIVATRGLIDLSDPQAVAVPAAFLAWMLDT